MKVNLTQLTAIIEAVLFASGHPVEVSELCSITETDEQTIQLVLERLSEKLDNDEECGVRLIQTQNAYRFVSKPQFYEYLVKLVQPRARTLLSNAALETLSIVAYNQPVTRSSIEFIRGVNSDGPLNKLIERGLVEECGKLDSPGKPLIYRTTYEFLKSFGLKTIEELPDIENVPLQLTFYDMPKNE